MVREKRKAKKQYFSGRATVNAAKSDSARNLEVRGIESWECARNTRTLFTGVQKFSLLQIS